MRGIVALAFLERIEADLREREAGGDSDFVLAYLTLSRTVFRSQHWHRGQHLPKLHVRASKG